MIRRYASVTVRKSEIKLHNNNVRFRLFNQLTEEYILEYEYYINGLIRLGIPYQTVAAKAQDLSRFYDYYNAASQIIESIGHSGSLDSPIVRIFNSFPVFLAFGEDAQDELASTVASILNSPSMRPSTIQRILSTVKQYTMESARIEESLYSSLDGLLNVHSRAAFGSELLTSCDMSEHEKKRLLSQSFLAGCISGGAQLTSSQLFKVPRIISKFHDDDLKVKSFPIKHAVEFCNGLNSARDKALYALLFGSGMRMHEALQTLILDIDFSTDSIVISTPEAQEFARNYTSMRRKGVDHYQVFLIEPFKSFFFDAAEVYWSQRQDSESEYFFLTAPRFGGKPMYEMSHQSIIDAFRSNLKRLNLNHLLHLSPHSIRHFYGFYMLNFCPVISDTGTVSYGYPLEKVRRFMRHSTIANTEKYAVPDLEKYKIEIEMANKLLEGVPVDLAKIQEHAHSKLMLSIFGE